MAYEVPPGNGEIRATLALSQAEAQTGSSRTLNLPGGRRITVPIPAGIYSGQEIRLAGQGEPAWQGGPIGDLVLTISIAPGSLPGQSNPGFNQFSETEYVSRPSFPPTALAPNYPPATAGGMPPYTAYPPQPANTAPSPAGSYPDYAPQQAQEQIYLPQNQNAYTAPPPYPTYPQPGQAGPQPYSPQPPRKRRVSPAIITLIIILVLLLLAGSALIYYVGVYQPKVQHDQATATAQAQLTAMANAQNVQASATANANASATANANATVTAQAQATANAQTTVNAQASATAAALQSILTNAMKGPLVLNDQLNAQSNNGWDVLLPANSSVGSSCQFTNGAYHSNMPSKGYFQPCYAENPTFTNFAFQIQMTINQGDEGGILFRANPNNSTYYLFRIATDGTYDLFVYSSNQANSAQSLLNGISTSFKTNTGQVNTITLVARGSNLYFYVNSQYLNTVSNGTFTSGKIGVFGESSATPTDVSFANAQVWQI
jgi:flagellar basal body-associated protein FliL